MARKLGKAISFKHCHKTLIKLVNFTVNCYFKTKFFKTVTSFVYYLRNPYKFRIERCMKIMNCTLYKIVLEGYVT